MELEKLNHGDYEKKGGEVPVILEKRENLFEVSEDLFEEKNFTKGDIVFIDNDETLNPTLQNILLCRSFKELPKDSKELLERCKENEVTIAIVTNMPRTNHYMNSTIPVFGYEHYFENEIVRKLEFPMTLLLGSLYKQSDRCLYEIGFWAMAERQKMNGGRIAWVANSFLDKIFAKNLAKTLKELEFDEHFYFYKVPTIRSFRK